MANHHKQVNSIELFCGTGGLALGLHNAGFDHKALYEWDRDSCENIRSNISLGFPSVQNWSVFQSDVRDVDYSQFVGNVRMVSGGPPCQPFSLGGKAKAHNDTRDMFPEAVRAVREIKPEAFIFENVKGLLRKSFDAYFSYIILQLTYPSIARTKEMSWEEHKQVLEKYHAAHDGKLKEYNVEYRLVNAADYGVPQLRYRVFIIGFRSDLDVDWAFPKPTHSKEALLYSKWVTNEYWHRHGLSIPKECPISNSKIEEIRKQIENSQQIALPWLTTRDAIGDLPDPRSEKARVHHNHDYRAGARVYPGHSGCLLDEPSKTIKAGAHGVPGGENMIILDSGEVRYYTVRESARIQTFPDEYHFSASWTESMRQIGNAVPVKLAEVVGRSVYDCLKR